MLTARWIQHPIGHGGFHSGWAHAGGSVFGWVYDCGARRTRKFDDYLRAWLNSAERTIDWLFVSHFDLDHVSGLDTLMGGAVVRDVLVPYVNRRELALLLLEEIGRDRLSRQLVELTANPGAYFTARGAERVTFLRGKAPEDDREDIETGPPAGPGEDRDWTVKIAPQPRFFPGQAAGLRQQRVIDGGTAELKAVAVTSGGMRFRAYCASLPPDDHDALLTALEMEVGAAVATPPGIGDLANAIAKHARTREGRLGLRAIYEAHGGSSNRSSLSVLSAPIPSGDGPPRYNVHPPRWESFSSGWGLPAWLNTGDAELLLGDDLDDWYNFFQGDISDVRVLALPHHGSDRNSDHTLSALVPNAYLAVHAREGSRKHPGIEVNYAAGSRLVKVTESPASELSMWYKG